MLVDFGSRIVNTDHVVSIDFIAGGYVATLTNGKTASITAGYASPGGLCGTVVPAAPGLTLVEAFYPSRSKIGEAIYFRSTPVVAFRVGGNGVAPIPIGGLGETETNSDREYAILQPDGQCFGWEQIWDSLDEFKADQQTVVDVRHKAMAHPATQQAEAPPVLTQAPSDPKGSDKTNPLLALRARIQAEPIEAPFADAPWRAGRDLAEVIDEVRHVHPGLHKAGVGYSPGWGWKWKPGQMERERADMTSEGNVAAFEASLRFLSHAGRQFASPRVNRKRTSYSWKHAAERVMGVYVPNGMLIAAAYALGFTVEVNRDSPNPYINLSEKAVALDPDRGM